MYCVMIRVSALTTDKGVALACVGPGADLQRETPGLLVGDVVPSDPRAAGRLPGERDAARVQGGEADVGGRDDQRFGWRETDIEVNTFNNSLITPKL